MGDLSSIINTCDGPYERERVITYSQHSVSEAGLWLLYDLDVVDAGQWM